MQSCPRNLFHNAAAGQMKKWNQSLALLKRLLQEFPDSPNKPSAQFEEGVAEQNLGHSAEALRLYETVAEKTESVVGARARFMMGEVLFDQRAGQAVAYKYAVFRAGGGLPQRENMTTRRRILPEKGVVKWRDVWDES